jgi:hypothetical protein
MTQSKIEYIKNCIDQIRERLFQLHNRFENEYDVVNDELWYEIEEQLRKIDVLLASMEEEIYYL